MPRLRVLFICSKNQWRSPTAEAIYRDHACLDVRSRGTSRRAQRTLTEQDLDWADLILVMENQHRERIREQHPRSSRDCHFHILEIEDRFRAMDPRLIKELKEAIDPIIEEHLSDL